MLDDETRFLELVRRFVKSRTSLSKASLMIGKDRTWLSKALSGDRPFTFKHLEQLLAGFEVDFDQFWSEILAGEIGYGYDTAGRLLKQFDGATTANEPLPDILEKIASVRPVSFLGPTSTISFQRWEYILNLLHSHRLAALAEAETWLLELWQHRIIRSSWETHKAQELCVALAIWSTIVRSLGKTSAAAFALKLAIEPHVGRGLVLSFGPVLEASARLLNDRGNPGLGFDCLREALSLYGIFNVQTSYYRTKIAIGIFAAYRGLADVAENSFAPCLEDPNLPENLRNIAAVNLSWIWQRTDQVEKARDLIGMIDESKLPERDRVNLKWVEALILLRERAFDSAAVIFRELLEHGESHLAPIDRLLFLLDYSECLLSLGAQREAEQLHPRMIAVAQTFESDAALAKELALRVLKGLAETTDPGVVRSAAARFRRAVQPGAAATTPL